MKLLAALDLAHSSPAVLREARIWAQRLAARLWIVHVAPPNPDFVGYETGPESVRDAVARQFHSEHRQLETFAEDLRAAGIDAVALLLQGPTADTILREADRLGVDAIVMGTFAHGPLRELLLGSAAKEVLRRSPRPVLLVPPLNQ